MAEMVSIEIGDWLPAPATAIRPMFAVGDVHGRDDLFAPLVEAIEGLILQDGMDDALLVTLGDYIDRGPENIKALNRALDGRENKIVSWIALPGNHEQYLCNFLHSEGARRVEVTDIWFDNGGTWVARELGFDPASIDAGAFSRAIERAIGDERMQRFRTLQNHVRVGDYLFVHAGIHPDIGLAMLDRDWQKLPGSWAEEDEDPLWVRGPFLTYDGKHEGGVIVVHGHTPRPEVELRANRINVDTRAYDLGRLTAVQLDGSRLRFIQAVGSRREPVWTTA
jgi:diadenosine tetraphosphatase ApaH/serine/threonine PP2A family protein phosphatase